MTDRRHVQFVSNSERIYLFFDWNSKREKTIRHFEDLEKEYKNPSFKIKKSEKSADESSTQDLKGLCIAMTETLNVFLDKTERQRYKRCSFETLELDIFIDTML